MQCKCAVNIAAEEWLNHAAIQEVFEARALRMAVNCAQNISKAPSQEEEYSRIWCEGSTPEPLQHLCIVSSSQASGRIPGNWVHYTEAGGTSKRAAWKALRSCPAECSYIGGLHGPLPGFCSWAVRLQCVPYSIREACKDPLNESTFTRCSSSSSSCPGYDRA